MKESNIPTEVRLYGKECHEEGYNQGWDKNTYTRRRRLFRKEESQFRRFGEFYDYLSDLIFENRRK